MNIRFLETVIRLSELRNFRVTAERMNITPAAISNRISAIEQELGVKLFNRDGREVSLTPEGAFFVEGARDVVSRYDRLVSELKPSGTVEGIIRMGVLPSIAYTILPAILDTLKQRFPRLQVEIQTHSSRDLLQALDHTELDIVFGIADDLPGISTERYQKVPLYSLGMFWLAGEGFPAEKDRMSAEDLLIHPIIAYEMGTTNYTRMTKYMPYGRLQTATVHYSNSLATTINMVASGIGISVLPAVVVSEKIESGQMQILDVHPTFPPTRYTAVYLDNAKSNLAPLVASIAAKAAEEFCERYDDALAKAL